MRQDRGMASADVDIITGEAVAIEVRPASFSSRLIGGIIDVIALNTVLMFLMIAVGAVFDGFNIDEALAGAIFIIFFVCFYVGVPTLVELLTRGRSLGKLAMGLQIVRDDGGPIRFRHAFIRALTGVLEFWMTVGVVAVLVSMFNGKGKRIGDLLAGTYSANVRAARRVPPVVMPPELINWVRAADIRRLPDGVALQTRTFLGRTTRLHPGSRQQLGMSLAATVEKYVAPAPPPGTHPERFLAAVLAERREREFATAMREKQRLHQQVATVSKLPFSP